MKHIGKIKSHYPAFKRDGNLAELIGVTLGDGNIHSFARTECLRIVGNSHNYSFIERYAEIVERVVKKRPAVRKRKASNATDIVIYEKYLSKRLTIPTGARGRLTIKVPSWIRRSKKMKIRFLRGLYEAEGSIHFHAKTYTHKLLFSNRNESLLSIVENGLKKLGFHPHRSLYVIQVSRKVEVQKLKKLLEFRSY
jgi:hypothetical protein